MTHLRMSFAPGMSVTLLITCALLSACGGGNNTSPPATTGNGPDYSKLKQSAVEAKTLAWATSESLELHLKNGIRLQSDRATVNYRENLTFDTSQVNRLSPQAQAESDTPPTTDGSFSDTNTHVAGVDEADYVKYDGSHIFAATQPVYYWNEPRPNASIRILATDPEQASVTEVSEISIENTVWGAVSELYLVKDSSSQATAGLATLRSSWSLYTLAEPTFSDVALSIYPSEPFDNQVELAIYDVSEPSQPTQSWKAEIDGYIQDSRKIGNILYLVTQYSPFIRGLHYYPGTDAQVAENEKLIAQSKLSDLLPSISINDGERQALVDPERCLIPLDRDQYHGFASITALVAIDLEKQAVSSSLCLNANVQGIYASEDNMYIGGSSQDSWLNHESFTAIHKISLNDGAIDYRSTGFVPGVLGWRDPAFHMDEHDGYFRVVSTLRNSDWQPQHRLSILEDSPIFDTMETVATLPNEDRPEAIGKPNEEIFSVRFREDRAFIVTFEQIDPLYVLDLTDPLDPQVAGELEVPGFSTYLHPINDNYLLGFGHDTDEGRQTGIKLSLFDISDASNPQEVNNLILGDRGSSSEALRDLRAASFLAPTTDQLRFTVPVNLYEANYTWASDGLHLFEVNGLDDNTARLSYVGGIIAESASASQRYPYYNHDRGVLHDDAVFYMHGADAFASFWTSPEAATGPH